MDLEPLKSRLVRGNSGYFILLCRMWTDKTAMERKQIVVPTYLIHNILDEAHSQVGHLGFAKTFGMIQQVF